MFKVGIAGFGFMGKTHFLNWAKMHDVKVSAICDANITNIKNKNPEGNIKINTDSEIDLSGVELYDEFDKMLEEADLDIVSISLPTFMHLDYTVRALKSGVHVFCEKPMGLNIKECEKMIQVSQIHQKQLMIGHCIRFWPEYVELKKLINNQKYGKMLVANFKRISELPTWSFNNWLLDEKLSGGVILDFHIHDTDFIQYVFDMPKSVYSRVIKGSGGRIDYIKTNYNYDDNSIVTAEGYWVKNKPFGFEMSFEVIFEKAIVKFSSQNNPTMKIYPSEGESYIPEFHKSDAYSTEIDCFLNTLRNNILDHSVSPILSKNSIEIILAEKRSAETGELVRLG